MARKVEPFYCESVPMIRKLCRNNFRPPQTDSQYFKVGSTNDMLSLLRHERSLSTAKSACPMCESMNSANRIASSSENNGFVLFLRGIKNGADPGRRIVPNHTQGRLTVTFSYLSDTTSSSAGSMEYVEPAGVFILRNATTSAGS